MKEVYILFIRPILEISAPLWAGALEKNKRLSEKLERVQRYVCRVIEPDTDPGVSADKNAINVFERTEIENLKKVRLSHVEKSKV